MPYDSAGSRPIRTHQPRCAPPCHLHAPSFTETQTQRLSKMGASLVSPPISDQLLAIIGQISRLFMDEILPLLRITPKSIEQNRQQDGPMSQRDVGRLHLAIAMIREGLGYASKIAMGGNPGPQFVVVKTGRMKCFVKTSHRLKNLSPDHHGRRCWHKAADKQSRK